MSCTAAQLWSRSLNIVSLSDMIEGSYRSWDFPSHLFHAVKYLDSSIWPLNGTLTVNYHSELEWSWE